MIAIIDYGMGNLRSVQKGFKKTGRQAFITSDPDEIYHASSIVLPGVGAFKDCMTNLSNLGLIEVIQKTIEEGKPFLGICLGLQLLFSTSEEFGSTKGIDILPGKVKKFQCNDLTLKIPHMGWNQVFQKQDTPLMQGVPDGAFFYFVHSYYVAPTHSEVISMTTEYGVDFTSGVAVDNLFAVQFHPEKSQEVGLKVLKNFGDL